MKKQRRMDEFPMVHPMNQVVSQIPGLPDIFKEQVSECHAFDPPVGRRGDEAFHNGVALFVCTWVGEADRFDGKLYRLGLTMKHIQPGGVH